MDAEGRHQLGRLGAALHGRRLESELPHDGEKVGFLQRFREEGGEDITVFRRICGTVGADSDNRRRCIFVVGTFDISSGALAVNYSST
jgi:hypothetical protein